MKKYKLLTFIVALFVATSATMLAINRYTWVGTSPPANELRTFRLSAPEAQAAAGPANFPYGIYNGCSGSIAASAGIATGTAVSPCNPAQLHKCIAFADVATTPVAGDVVDCNITTFGIVTVVGTASATVTVTGVKVLYATANANATVKWMGY